ncbi:hypothetical protein DPMN_113880 [Dreissena polymorpha]|uniref:Uncharacterized protein n=1 Tax=Dreissena polymorpha TaxID=45954 RepID=A0A9D4KJU1_DREPO|nr:hypothetical protein DPMN_113880 [Dreissena polymorpha]
MADTGLKEFKGTKTHVWELPLTHDGVFGERLEKKLKERQEINKQLSVLLPEVDRERKFPSTSATPSGTQWKRQCFSTDDRFRRPAYGDTHQGRQTRSLAGFTIPKVPRPNTPRTATVSYFRPKSKQ